VRDGIIPSSYVVHVRRTKREEGKRRERGREGKRGGGGEGKGEEEKGRKCEGVGMEREKRGERSIMTVLG